MGTICFGRLGVLAVIKASKTSNRTTAWQLVSTFLVRASWVTPWHGLRLYDPAERLVIRCSKASGMHVRCHENEQPRWSVLTCLDGKFEPDVDTEP
jgi:hypothetical protein